MKRLEEHFKDLFKVVPKQGAVAESAEKGDGTEETGKEGDEEKEVGGAEGGAPSFGSVEDALKQIMSKLIPGQVYNYHTTSFYPHTRNSSLEGATKLKFAPFCST